MTRTSLFIAGLAATALSVPAAAQQEFGSPELIAAAKQEGRLVLYTPNFAEVEQEVINAFHKRFPEIKTDMVRPPGGLPLNRIKTEGASTRPPAYIIDHSDRGLTN